MISMLVMRKNGGAGGRLTFPAASLGATVMRSAVEEVFWYVSTRSFSGMVRVLPAAPMAMPTSAAFRAGASLTPSPIMHTEPPLCWQVRM